MSTMRHLFEEGRLKEAANIAKAAAPYVHPKAQPQARAGDLAALRDDELDRFENSGSGTGAAPQNTGGAK
jgi:hypothetical protein